MRFTDEDIYRVETRIQKRYHRGAGYVAKCIVRWICVIIFAVLCFSLAIGGGFYFGFRNSVPEITLEDTAPHDYPTTILDANGNKILELADFGTRADITKEELTDNLKYAFIDIEDQRFYEHNGVDLKGIIRAVYNTLTQDSTEGASTITQQLLKNNVFETGGQERNMMAIIRRKVQEWTLAVLLEQQTTKDDILVNYLNTVNMGKGNYGIKSAALYYYGKNINELSVAQIAALAAIPRSPSAYNPISHPENNEKRKNAVLRKMNENGHLDNAAYQEALQEDVYSCITGYRPVEESPVYPYFVESLIDNVMNDLQEKMGYSREKAYDVLYSGGLTIYSTQVPELQAIVDSEINDPSNYSWDTTYSFSWSATVTHPDDTYDEYNESDIQKYFRSREGNQWVLDFATKTEAENAIETFKNSILHADDVIDETVYYTLQPQASFSLMDYRTGEVLAICGGRGAKETSRSLNRGSSTVRQPGSTFKVLASFAPALDAGNYTLATLVEDAPFNDGVRSIHNWWGESYRGYCSIRTAIRDSMNVIACKTLNEIGVNLGLDYLERFGFTTIDKEEDNNLVLAIGGITNGVTNLELCAAYSAIANDGIRMEPFFYTKIENKDGEILMARENVQEQSTVLQKETASLLTSALQDVVSEAGTGKDAAIKGTPVAGKTGTTSDSKDYWFAGYIPNGLVGAVWIGHDRNLPMPENQHAHAALFSKIMGRVAQAANKTGGSFTMNGFIEQRDTCKRTGQLAVSGCQYDYGTYKEYFNLAVMPPYCGYHSGW